MTNIFTYRGQNVDELTADQMRDALKQCIHDLEQERRYKYPNTEEVFKYRIKENLHASKYFCDQYDINQSEVLGLNPTQNSENKNDL